MFGTKRKVSVVMSCLILQASMTRITSSLWIYRANRTCSSSEEKAKKTKLSDTAVPGPTSRT